MPDSASQWIGLFPLKTLLFPEGMLPLRVFETRYVDMVRECMKANKPFGIVGIQSGNEVGKAALPYSVGTLANITHWDMPEFGVLMIQTHGGERFRILETRVLPDQRLEGRIEIIGPDLPVGQSDVSEILAVCAKVLGKVIDDIVSQADNDNVEYFISPFAEPFNMDDAGWVANRWCEILPIPLEEKQQLLEMRDAHARLIHVEAYLRKNRVI